MKVKLLSLLSDRNVDVAQVSSQRQLVVSVSALADQLEGRLPLNLCLILDKSGSMHGKPMQTVMQAVEQLLNKLQPGDRISIVAFSGAAEVIVPHQVIQDPSTIKSLLPKKLIASGGTAIAAGLELGITELMQGAKGAVSQAFLLTDGHGESSLRLWKWEIGNDDNKRCLELAQKAAKINLTINTLGFGNNWNSDLLEKIADAGGGSLAYIEHPEQVLEQFGRLFGRITSIGLTNAYLQFSLAPHIRLAELKPIAQVFPDTIELPVQQTTNGGFKVRLGDLMQGVDRVVLVNLYLGKLPAGEQVIGQMQICYDDPASNQDGLLSPMINISANFLHQYQPALNPQVQQSILTLAKYRQTQLAEMKLQQGDRIGAATMLQTAANTALQIGDTSAAQVLQTSATRLQTGEQLSSAELKKTRIVSKTTLQN
ncbi:vWA domain-containing protein [Nostoc piscinale]|uniref:vWA domain-containing protein n=1 Tax=Nostoc piscinale TaxID=224012 RepID=UPI0039A65551